MKIAQNNYKLDVLEEENKEIAVDFVPFDTIL